LIARANRIDQSSAASGKSRVQRIGLDPHDHPAGVGRDDDGRGGSNFNGRVGRRAWHVHARSNPRDPEIAHDEQARRPAEINPGVVYRTEGPGQKIDRDVPSVSRPDGGRGQRDNPAADRGHRLVC